jgi:hypothetical protein
MSPPPKVDLKALIAGDVAPAVMMDDPPPPALPPEPERVVAFHQPPPPSIHDPAASPQGADARGVGLSRAAGVRAARVLAFEERTKMHTLMLEAVDLLLKKRGQPSIKKLMGAGTPGYQDAVRRERSDARNR